MATSDAQDNQKWFIDRIDYFIQNLIEVHQSDYDSYSANLQEADEGLTKGRNTIWQVVAGIVTVALGLAALKVINNTALLALLAGFGLLGLVATSLIEIVRRWVNPQLDKVDAAYNSTRLQLLYLQNWFVNTTIHLTPLLTQEKLDLYYDFVRCASGAQYSAVLGSVVTFEAQLKLVKPGEALKPELQRLVTFRDRGYGLYLQRRLELQDATIFSDDLRAMLEPFETRYQKERADTKAPALKPTGGH